MQIFYLGSYFSFLARFVFSVGKGIQIKFENPIQNAKSTKGFLLRSCMLSVSLSDFFVPFETTLIQRTCEANPVGENSSFIFIVCVKSVPLYHFKLAYVVLHIAVKKIFETHF